MDELNFMPISKTVVIGNLSENRNLVSGKNYQSQPIKGNREFVININGTLFDNDVVSLQIKGIPVRDEKGKVVGFDVSGASVENLTCKIS